VISRGDGSGFLPVNDPTEAAIAEGELIMLLKQHPGCGATGLGGRYEGGTKC